MSDGASGSALLAGNPAGDQAAGNGGAPTNLPDGAVSNNAGNPVVPAANNGNWYDSIEDADLKGYVQNKGWKDTVELANGYRNLEKLVGVDKLPMPKDDADAEGWNRIYDRLGRPKTADDYKLPVPEGDTGEFAKIASGKFHELGLTAKQAQGLAEWWNGQQGSMKEQMMQQSAAKAEADLTALRSEWGQAWDENVEMGRRAAREYGLTGDLDKLEQALGTSKMLKMMAAIGRAQGEHTYQDGGTPMSGRFGMTPEAAKSRISALQQDPGWTAKYLSGDADAKAELAKLMSAAYPE